MVFRIKNIIIAVLIISLLGGPLAYQTYATDWFAALRFSLDTAARAAAWGAFTAVSNKILNKVKTGGLAGALFVQDWRKFQLQAQTRGEDIWRGLLYFAANGDGDIPPLLCDHIRNSLAFNSLQPTRVNNLIQNLPAESRRVNSLQEYLIVAKCDPVVNENYDKFMEDFSAGGGWNMWERMLQPQNNIFGTMEMAFDELGKQRKIEESAAINESGGGGGGFIGLRECLTQTQRTSACAILGRIKTPGSTIGEQVVSVFDANLKFYTTADAASLAIAALAQFLVNKLFDSGGLAGADTSERGVTMNTEGNSLKNEFCTARNNMSQKAKAYIRSLTIEDDGVDGPKVYDEFKPQVIPGWTSDGGKSYCSDKFQDDDNPYPFERCVNRCLKAVGLLPQNVEAPSSAPPPVSPSPTSSPTSPPPSGACADPGNTSADYTGKLQEAIDAVIANNPDGIADADNVNPNRFTFINFVASELQSSGFNATTAVLNGSGNPNSGDLIALWQSGDTTMERYDILTRNRADGTIKKIREAAWIGFIGDIPLTCVSE